MKKVTIITECRRFRLNYGETLQAVALNRIITGFGYDCTTASFENQKRDFEWLWRNREYVRRAMKFEQFRIHNVKRFFLRSNNKADFKKWLSNSDIAVCGSDVIWYEKCYNSVFFLNFPGLNIKKIAYAPSLRDGVVSDECYKKKAARWVKDFDYLSTREKEGSEIIAALSGREVKTVLDPTLLLDKSEWDRMCSGRQVKGNYIFLYIIGRTSELTDVLQEASEMYPGREFVWIKMEENDGYPKGRVLLDVGPSEFISLVKFADAVITDSFHGCAFSIIYNKRFFPIKRVIDQTDMYDDDVRLRNVLEKICKYDSNKETNSPHKWVNVDDKLLKKEKKISKQYLYDALTGKDGD